MNLQVIILAAGKGTRMRSSLPKVLHKIADKPMVEHVICTAQTLNPNKIIGVFGHGGDIVPQQMKNHDVIWVEQAEQLGTGHAVDQAMCEIDDDATVLVLYGDVPLTTKETLTALLSVMSRSEQSVGLLTARLHNPTGYGRIVRNAMGVVQRIVEQKDATDSEQQINEVNTGILSAPGKKLKTWLSNLNNENSQGEYYLTDIFEMAVNDGYTVQTHTSNSLWEIEGVNNKRQLASLERQHQILVADTLMENGVTLMDPTRIDVRGTLITGNDCLIDINTLFTGKVVLGDGTSIGANSVIINSSIGKNVKIYPNSIVENSTIGDDCDIGPFARIRPDTVLANKVKVGNFVEIKKSTINIGSKINHLSYVGDTVMGSNVNVGAGTITCNYDGANKSITEIGDDVFIGSDTQLIAPVTVGNGATIGAGSTISKNVPSAELTLSRSKQLTVKGWERPTKKS
ncbi:MAG: bifunctional UDP-N-acetylglucosamine diphosphorylase/glucosamine-1-phosphate N-acetyltransferase GlmU [Gammaproteobacteria bacterium]|nr:bifunctional UDP-N-acetylglucosamine diphosphorylase/glucosamine-1-phosphate N-acetyltransferase GlmU [Gammaproteobacteria bacterium]